MLGSPPQPMPRLPDGPARPVRCSWLRRGYGPPGFHPPPWRKQEGLTWELRQVKGEACPTTLYPRGATCYALWSIQYPGLTLHSGDHHREAPLVRRSVVTISTRRDSLRGATMTTKETALADEGTHAAHDQLVCP